MDRKSIYGEYLTSRELEIRVRDIFEGKRRRPNRDVPRTARPKVRNSPGKTSAGAWKGAVDVVNNHNGSERDLLKKLKPYSRLFRALDWAEFLEWMYKFREQNYAKVGPPTINSAAGWRHKRHCMAWPVAPPQKLFQAVDNTDPEHNEDWHSRVCLGGQYGWEGLQDIRPNSTLLATGELDGWDRLWIGDTWWRPYPGNTTGAPEVAAPGAWPEIDPNIVRGLPAPVITMDDEQGYAEPLREPERHKLVEVVPASVPYRPIARARLAPPGPRESQGKAFTRSRRVAIWFVRALDQISEAADLVDALFEALPENVRKKWEKKFNKFGDKGGQFATDNAQYKLQALYYNWEKLDYAQAVANVIKNNLQDAIIANMARIGPRRGVATSGGEAAVAGAIDDFFDWLWSSF